MKKNNELSQKAERLKILNAGMFSNITAALAAKMSLNQKEFERLQKRHERLQQLFEIETAEDSDILAMIDRGEIKLLQIANLKNAA